MQWIVMIEYETNINFVLVPTHSCMRSLSLLLFFKQLQRSYYRFLTFYTSQHNGRKLNWLYKLSKVRSVPRCGYIDA